jgi:hypothetical protein
MSTLCKRALTGTWSLRGTEGILEVLRGRGRITFGNKREILRRMIRNISLCARYLRQSFYAQKMEKCEMYVTERVRKEKFVKTM